MLGPNGWRGLGNSKGARRRGREAMGRRGHAVGNWTPNQEGLDQSSRGKNDKKVDKMTLTMFLNQKLGELNIQKDVTKVKGRETRGTHAFI